MALFKGTEFGEKAPETDETMSGLFSGATIKLNTPTTDFKYTPAVTEAVARTYPVAVPERQEPVSMLSKIKSSGAYKDVARGFLQLQQMGAGLSAVGYKTVGWDDLATSYMESAVQVGQKIEDKYAPEIGSYKNIENLGDAGVYAREAILGNIATLIPSIVTGGLSGVVTKKIVERTIQNRVAKLVSDGIAKDIAEKQVAKEVAKKIAVSSTLGALPSTAGMETGSIATDIYKETGRIEPGTALTGGIIAGSLDVLPQFAIFKKTLGPNIASDIKKSLVRRLGTEGAKQFLSESSTEAVQTLIEIGAVSFESGKPMLNRETFDNMLDAFLQGGIGGATMETVAEAYVALRKQEIGEETKQNIEKSGIGESVRNAIETNGIEEVTTSLVNDLRVTPTEARYIVDLSMRPSQAELARDAQRTRDEVVATVRLQKQSTDEIISDVDEMISETKEMTSSKIADLENELNQLRLMREELERRQEPEAKAMVESMRLLPAPKALKLLSAPKDMKEGSTVKIGTIATGQEREAEVVEVRNDSIVAIVKNDPNFPPVPMVYPADKFQYGAPDKTLPKPKKLTEEDYKSASERLAEIKAEMRRKAREAREKQVEETPAEIEGKKPTVIEKKKAEIDEKIKKLTTPSEEEKALGEAFVHGRVGFKGGASQKRQSQRLEKTIDNAKEVLRLQREKERLELQERREAKRALNPQKTIANKSAKETRTEKYAREMREEKENNVAKMLHQDAFGGKEKNFQELVREAKSIGLAVESGESEGSVLSIPYSDRENMTMMEASKMFSAIINEKARITGATYRIEPNKDGSLTAFHGTSEKNAQKINKEGFETQAYLSPEKGKEAGGVGGAMEYGDDVFAVTFDPRYMELNGLGEIKIESEYIISYKQIAWKQSAQVAGKQSKEESTTTKTQEPIVTSALKKKAQSEKLLKVLGTEKGGSIIYKKIGEDEAGNLYKPFIEHEFPTLEAGDVFLEKLLGKDISSEPTEMVVDNSVETLLKTHDETVDKLRDGKITPQELKDAFALMVSRESDILAWLNKMTIGEMRKKFGGYPRRDDKKADVVKSSYRNLLELYAPSEMISYHAFSESYSEAVARYVNSATEETIAEYAKKVAERTAERKAYLEDKIQGIKDPQTLDQFRTFIEVNGVDKLSTEQRIRYDALVADKIKADTEKAIQQKALVKGVDAGVGFEMKQTKHTKTGADLFVVTMGARVEKEVYSQLNSAAKRLGGYYSSFRGSGAIPGFQFKTAEDAQTFMLAGQGETVDAGAKMEERAQDQKSKTTNKLATLADTLEERATEKLNQDRKTNTAKRAREASGAEADARADIQMARTMRNLAGAIETGRAKYLDGVSAKTHVEELELLVYRAKNAELLKQYPDYGEREKHKGEPITDETITNIKASDFLPSFRVENFRSDVLDVLSKKKGWKLITNRYYKKMYDGTGGSLDYWTPSSVKEADEVRQMVRESGVGSHNVMNMNTEHYARLRAMGVENLPQLRAMVREFVTFRGDAVEEDKAKELERALIGAKVGFDFFPTPRSVADQMVQEAGIREGMKVLEPSAGNGNIAGAIKDAGVSPDVIELSSQLREVLEAKGYNVVGQDFLDHTEGGYDAIVMNPPFSNNADIEHVRHAYDLLAPGGKLVSIVGEGAFFRSGKTETEFRDWLDAMGASVEQLPAGTFKDTSLMATTGANGRMVVIEKPEAHFARKGQHVDEEFRDAVASGINALTSQDMLDANGQIDYALMQEVEYLKQGFEKGKDKTEDVNRGAEILASKGGMKDFMRFDFARKDGGLTTKIIETLGNRETVSKQFIIDATKQQGISGAERDLILRMVAEEGDKVNVKDFADKVRTELLPLNPRTKETGKNVVGGARFVGYSEVALRGDERGDIANYIETIYESPIETNVGEIHFPGDTERYFAHSRKEDLPPQGAKRDEKTFEFPVGTIRRILEIQSDLMQRGRLESEKLRYKASPIEETDNELVTQKRGNTKVQPLGTREKEIAQLENYRNSWQDRIIREEVRQAALDGKTKLQFPTGETAMKIEGLGQHSQWVVFDKDGNFDYENTYADFKVGDMASPLQPDMSGELAPDGEWIITDILGNGKFKAVPKRMIEEKMREWSLDFNTAVERSKNSNFAETFDISGKVDTENPIYKFYEKEVAKYLRNKYGAKLVTDEQGVTWNEVTITPDMAGPVLAFRTSGDLHDAESGPMADPTFVRQQVASFANRLNLDINVHFVDTIYTGEKSRAVFAMSGEPEDVQAWAATIGRDIVFTKQVPTYTPAHEVLHFVVNNLNQMSADFGVTRLELLTAQNGGKMPRSRAEEQKLGEDLAHGFEKAWEASQKGEAHGFKGVIGRFFDTLIDSVKRMLNIPRSNEEIIHRFYEKALYMRRRGGVVSDRSYGLERFETAPGVLNFGVQGSPDFARKLSNKELSLLPEDDQRRYEEFMIMEDIRSDAGLLSETLDAMLDGKLKISTRTDIKNDIRETIGRGLYMRIFSNDKNSFHSSWDEVVANLREQGYPDLTENDLVDALLDRNEKRKEIAKEHQAFRDQAREARAKQIAEAKTEKEKIAVIKAIERELAQEIAKNRMDVSTMGAKQGVSRFHERTKLRYGAPVVILPYQKVTRAGEQAKAEKYYEANKQATIDMAMDVTQAPSDVKLNSVSLVVLEKAQEEGNAQVVADVLPKLSQRATAQGQEISMLRDVFHEKNPLTYMNQLLAYRRLLIERKYRPMFGTKKEESNVEVIVERKVKKAREKSGKLKELMQVKEQDFNDFISQFAC